MRYLILALLLLACTDSNPTRSALLEETGGAGGDLGAEGGAGGAEGGAGGEQIGGDLGEGGGGGESMGGAGGAPAGGQGGEPARGLGCGGEPPFPKVEPVEDGQWTTDCARACGRFVGCAIRDPITPFDPINILCTCYDNDDLSDLGRMCREYCAGPDGGAFIDLVQEEREDDGRSGCVGLVREAADVVPGLRADCSPR